MYWLGTGGFVPSDRFHGLRKNVTHLWPELVVDASKILDFSHNRISVTVPRYNLRKAMYTRTSSRAPVTGVWMSEDNFLTSRTQIWSFRSRMSESVSAGRFAMSSWAVHEVTIREMAPGFAASKIMSPTVLGRELRRNLLANRNSIAWGNPPWKLRSSREQSHLAASRGCSW